ncbi:hypothetical protein Ancab_012370 [Ancistrocladus abbreviatus]
MLEVRVVEDRVVAMGFVVGVQDFLEIPFHGQVLGSVHLLLLSVVCTLCGSSWWWSFFDLLVTTVASAILGVTWFGLSGFWFCVGVLLVQDLLRCLDCLDFFVVAAVVADL